MRLCGSNGKENVYYIVEYVPNNWISTKVNKMIQQTNATFTFQVYPYFRIYLYLGYNSK